MSRLQLGGAQRLPLIQQTEAAECGLACLAMISSYHGHRVDMNTLRRRYPISLKGVTLRGLIQIAHHMNLAGRALRFELDEDQHRIQMVVNLTGDAAALVFNGSTGLGDQPAHLVLVLFLPRPQRGRELANRSVELLLIKVFRQLHVIVALADGPQSINLRSKFPASRMGENTMCHWCTS